MILVIAPELRGRRTRTDIASLLKLLCLCAQRLSYAASARSRAGPRFLYRSFRFRVPYKLESAMPLAMSTVANCLEIRTVNGYLLTTQVQRSWLPDAASL